jgi:xylulokinase
MLCGLAAGLDAVRAVGVRDKRLLLIGGAAQSPVVQVVASQVFDAPAFVPTPGEYVANGAAMQAAWALRGERPRWPLELVGQPERDHRPEIRTRYKNYAASVERTIWRGAVSDIPRSEVRFGGGSVGKQSTHGS